MHNPHYLFVSRHNIYYFRYPLPNHLHPKGKATTIKLSLKTRCPHEALQIARSLIYFAEYAIKNLKVLGMDYQETRELLTHFFKEACEKAKGRIAKYGRLTEEEKTIYTNCHSFTVDALKHDNFYFIGRQDQLQDFMQLQKIDLKEGSEEYKTLRTEYVKAYRDYCTSVLDYDKSFDSYDFGDEVERIALQKATKKTSQKKLSDTINLYIEEKLRLKEWTPKSAEGFRSQLNLLLDYLGQDASLHISSETANDIKRMLMQIPKNSKSIPALRKMSIQELRTIEGRARMSSKNIAKYLNTYSAFYDWAVKRKETDENNFRELLLKKDTSQVRDAFSDEQVVLMLDEINNNKRGLINKEYQKWGVLIGMYTGARLNEIGQLGLNDLRQEDGIWCFDLNDKEEEGKRLKTQSSRRLIPIHADLIRMGILEYADALRKEDKGRFLHELSFDKNNGYGRNLGRWFSERFLKELGIKTRELVFHSFRHTVLTKLLQADVDEPIAKTIVGHTLQGVTHKTYAKGYKVAQLKEAIDKLDYQVKEEQTSN